MQVAMVVVPLKVVNIILESDKATLRDVFKRICQLFMHFGTVEDEEVKNLMQKSIEVCNHLLQLMLPRLCFSSRFANPLSLKYLQARW